MAILPDNKRTSAMGHLVASLFLQSDPGLSIADIQAAIDSTDTWINNNTSSFNNSIPEPAKSTLTQAQKNLLFFTVTNLRLNS